MKNRSPFSVMLLSIVTLGLYDLYWYTATARELRDKYHQAVKRPGLLVLSVMLRAASLLAFAWVAYVMFFAGHVPPVSDNCWKQYSFSATPETSKILPYTDACKVQITQNQRQDDRQYKAFELAGLAFVLGLLAVIVQGRWLVSYVKAAEVVTNGKVNASNVMLALLGRAPLGMALLQQAYNNPNSMPAFAANNAVVPMRQALQEMDNSIVPPQHAPLVKRLLTAVIVVLLLGFALFGAVVWYGTHG